MQPDPRTDKFRLYQAEFNGGQDTQPQPLHFSDGETADFDPVVAPNESFIIFSSFRKPTPGQQNALFVAFSNGHKWQAAVIFRPFLLGVESRLSLDLRTLYFTSDYPTMETLPKAQNSSAASIPQQIWEVSLEGQSAMKPN